MKVLLNLKKFRTKIYLFRRRKHRSQGDLGIKLKKYLNKRNGFYIEIGANDGIHQSNTFYLENYKKWTGVLVEPGKLAFSKLTKNRSSKNIIVNAACVPFYFKKKYINFNDFNLMSFTEEVNTDNDILNHTVDSQEYIKSVGKKSSNYQVPALTLTEILIKNKAPNKIDFFSLDVEGEELSVLEGLDFSEFKIEYILIESRNLNRTKEFLENVNYQLIEDYGSDYLFKLIIK